MNRQLITMQSMAGPDTDDESTEQEPGRPVSRFIRARNRVPQQFFRLSFLSIDEKLATVDNKETS